MKTNEATRGGPLRPEFYPVYAQYFVQYLRGMQAYGVRLDAVTVQNEPLYPGSNPSLLIPAEPQAEFIGRYLGPALRQAGLKTRIICHDHNADQPEYPLMVLGNPAANPYVDGSAFHLYAGPIEALSRVHDAFPIRHIYFTQEWVGALDL